MLTWWMPSSRCRATAAAQLACSPLPQLRPKKHLLSPPFLTRYHSTDEINELVYLILDNLTNSSGRDLILETEGGGCIRREMGGLNSQYPCTEFRNAEFVTATITEGGRGVTLGTAIVGIPYNFVVRLTRPNSVTRMNSLTIDYAFTGSASFGTDYTVSGANSSQNATLTFSPTDVFKTLTVTPTVTAVRDDITLTISTYRQQAPILHT